MCEWQSQQASKAVWSWLRKYVCAVRWQCSVVGVRWLVVVVEQGGAVSSNFE